MRETHEPMKRPGRGQSTSSDEWTHRMLRLGAHLHSDSDGDNCSEATRQPRGFVRNRPADPYNAPTSLNTGGCSVTPSALAMTDAALALASAAALSTLEAEAMIAALDAAEAAAVVDIARHANRLSEWTSVETRLRSAQARRRARSRLWRGGSARAPSSPRRVQRCKRATTRSKRMTATTTARAVARSSRLDLAV